MIHKHFYTYITHITTQKAKTGGPVFNILNSSPLFDCLKFNLMGLCFCGLSVKFSEVQRRRPWTTLASLFCLISTHSHTLLPFSQNQRETLIMFSQHLILYFNEEFFSCSPLRLRQNSVSLSEEAEALCFVLERSSEEVWSWHEWDYSSEKLCPEKRKGNTAPWACDHSWTSSVLFHLSMMWK